MLIEWQTYKLVIVNSQSYRQEGTRILGCDIMKEVCRKLNPAKEQRDTCEFETNAFI